MRIFSVPEEMAHAHPEEPFFEVLVWRHAQVVEIILAEGMFTPRMPWLAPTDEVDDVSSLGQLVESGSLAQPRFAGLRVPRRIEIG